MNNTRLAELLLQRLYDKATAKGYNSDHLLADLVDESADVFQVQTVAKMLVARGLIDTNVGYFHPKRGVYGRITGEGCLFVEQEGQARPVHEPTSPRGDVTIQIDQSTHFNSPITKANVAVRSSGVTQELGLPQGTAELLDGIRSTIRQDESISRHQQAQAWDDVELLTTELKRSEPRVGTVKEVLARLGDISSIASLVAQLVGMLPK